MGGRSTGVRHDETLVRSSWTGEAVEGGHAEGGHDALTARQNVLVGLEGFVSLCGLAGGIYMSTHPVTVMPVHYLQGTWFHTWRWPGLALLFFVGICPALVIVATIQRRPVAHVGHLCVGLGLVAWVALEAAWIVVSPGLQLTIGAIGVFILVLGVSDLIRANRALELAARAQA